MNYQQAIEFLHELGMFGARLGLDVTRRLAGLAGNPQERLRFIHVAGTNGKGSTCAMLESIYRHAGLRVGLFTSPHLVAFAERIQVNRQLIPNGEIARLMTGLRPLIETFPPDQKPTFFEAVTVLALCSFAGQHCDLVVWETGLGGRLDATNIVTPLASVITNIDLDHQQWLGETLDKIAAEKAGIIKAGVPVITAAQPGRGLEVIINAARALNSPVIHVADRPAMPAPSEIHPAPIPVIDLESAWSAATAQPGAMPALPLLGRHQRQNAAVALATINTLKAKIPVTEAALRDGLSRVWWPGRMQTARTASGQHIVLDGAHNAASAAALRETFAAEFPGASPALLLGVLSDKDWSVIASTLAPLARRILLVPVNSARTLSPAKLSSACREANPAVEPEMCVSLEEGLKRAASEPFLLITGSLYLVGEAMERLRLSPAPPTDERRLNEWAAQAGAAR